MRLLTLPGVFPLHSDSLLLVDHLREAVEPGASVADVCTGSGVLAVAAARAGAGSVAAARLRPGGAVLIVHSSVCDADRTVAMLAAGGLGAEVVARSRGPLGPLLCERRAMLERRGLLPPDARDEELVVVRGAAPRAVGGARA